MGIVSELSHRGKGLAQADQGDATLAAGDAFHGTASRGEFCPNSEESAWSPSRAGQAAPCEVSSEVSDPLLCLGASLDPAGSFPAPLHPLPEPSRGLLRQRVSELAREQDQLAAMVRLVRHEVAEKVLEVCREVLPGAPGNGATARSSKLDQTDQALATARQRPQERARRYSA